MPGVEMQRPWGSAGCARWPPHPRVYLGEGFGESVGPLLRGSIVSYEVNACTGTGAQAKEEWRRRQRRREQDRQCLLPARPLPFLPACLRPSLSSPVL